MTTLERLRLAAEMEKSIAVLSVHQPYASAIASGVKPYENRGWSPPKSLRGELLAIHATKGAAMMTPGNLAEVRFLWPKMPAKDLIPRGEIVCVARLTDCIRVENIHPGDPGLRWCCGPFCWKLEDPVPVSFKATGSQGIWYHPARPILAALAG